MVGEAFRAPPAPPLRRGRAARRRRRAALRGARLGLGRPRPGPASRARDRPGPARAGRPDAGPRAGMTSLEPELWVERPREAIAFYEQAFGAGVLHLVGMGDDVVAQLAVGDARFWISTASPDAPTPRPATAPPAGRCWSSTIRRRSQREPSRREPPSWRRWPTNTAGGWGASRTRPGTNGRSAARWAPGRPRDLPPPPRGVHMVFTRGRRRGGSLAVPWIPPASRHCPCSPASTRRNAPRSPSPCAS